MKFPLITVLVSLALAVELAAAQNELRLRLETQTRGTLVVGAKPTASVNSLKQVVEENDGIEQDLQVLLYGDKVLSGDKLLSDYKIGDGAQVIVARLSPSQPSLTTGSPQAVSPRFPKKDLNFEITVALRKEGETRSEFEIELSPTDDVLTMKRKIFEKTRLPLERQTLMFNGANLRDHAKPGDYGVRAGSTVFLNMINTHVL